MKNSPYIVAPGKKLKLAKRSTDDTGHFKDKEQAADETAHNLRRLDELQERLYAEGRHALLVVIQAMDCGGKDGTVRTVIGPLNPLTTCDPADTTRFPWACSVEINFSSAGVRAPA